MLRRILIGTAIIVTAASGTVRAQVACWPIEDGGNGHSYQRVTSPDTAVTWDTARLAAEAAGGYLATMTSAEEVQFIRDSFPPLPPLQEQSWLGGYQPPGSPEPDGGWTWVTDEPWSYTNWGAGEPNDRSREDALQTNNEGTWNDLPRNHPVRSYLIEYDVRPAGPLRYAALGDSYSSGEGTFDYLFTDGDPSPECHRSRLSYPWLLQSPDLTGGPEEAFVACSGAKIEDVMGGGAAQPQEGETQIAQIAPGPWDVITISIGGNDVGFSSFLQGCLRVADCSLDLELEYLRQLPGLLERVPVLGTILDNGVDPETYWERVIDSKLTQLPDVYNELVGMTTCADPSRVYVLGYPHLFSDVPGSGCLADFPLPLLTQRERAFLNAGADRLNCVIAAAAAGAGVNFVPVKRWFKGHEVCAPGGTDNQWLNGLFPRSGLSFDLPTLNVDFDFDLNKAESFHPNPLGYQFGYARALDAHIAGFSPLPEDCSELTVQGKTMGASEDSPTLEFGELEVAPVEPGCASDVFVREQSVQVTGRGFRTGSTVVLILRSGDAAPTELAEATADESGQIELTIALPSTATVGEYAFFEAAGESGSGNGLLLHESVAIASSDVADVDGDGVPDICDNCLNVANADQVDSDFDGIGDNCDACPDDPRNDWDGDGLCRGDDPCEFDAANDADGDGVCEGIDNCPTVSNPDQADSDFDGRGDACVDLTCYRVSVEVVPVDLGAVAVTPPNCLGSMYEEGTVVEASAAPVGDNDFIRWEEGASSSEEESVAVVVDRDLTLRAVFAVSLGCPGDCDSDGVVTINELIRGVNIALGRADQTTCSSFDGDRNGAVSVAELVRGVNAALKGCPI